MFGDVGFCFDNTLENIEFSLSIDKNSAFIDGNHENFPYLHSFSKEEQCEFAKENLRKHNLSVDYVLTHKREQSKSSVPRDEKLYDLCEFIEANVDYKKWYFGHSHKKCEVDAKHEFIYDELKSL